MKSRRCWYHVQPRQWQVILLLALMLLGPRPVAQTKQTRRLALSVAAPWEGETAMQNDLVATYKALLSAWLLPRGIPGVSRTPHP